MNGSGEGYGVFPLMRTSVRAVGVKRTPLSSRRYSVRAYTANGIYYFLTSRCRGYEKRPWFRMVRINSEFSVKREFRLKKSAE